MNLDDLLDAWGANCRLNRMVLDACGDEDLDLKPGKGKTIRSNFVHIVGVRRAHVEERSKQEALAIAKMDWKTATKAEIEEALRVSDESVAELFHRLAEPTKPTRWSLHRFFAYNLAHEAHHRSQIEIALRLNGREPSDEFLFSLWNWPKL